MKNSGIRISDRKRCGFCFRLSMVIILLSGLIYAQGNWGPASNLGRNVNPALSEAGSSISADSSKLYFTSGRDGGYGLHDIWVSEKQGAVDAGLIFYRD